MANVKISGLTAAGSVVGANEFEINEAGTSKKVTGAQILAYVKANTAPGDIGAAVADADIAYVDVDQTWSGAQRGTVTTDNDGSFDMNVTNNFKCTPTGTFTLTFTNITAGQSGWVLLVNTSGYSISAAATTKVGASTLATISTAGTYLLSYFTDGTNVYVTASGALS
jgi:hypothetical protein